MSTNPDDLRVNRAAIENAEAFDRARGGKTMPDGARPVDRYHRPVKRQDQAPRPGEPLDPSKQHPTVRAALEGQGAFLAERRTGLGATDMSAILGKNPWVSALKVWQLKLQLVPDDPMNEAMEWGIIHEPVIAEKFMPATGLITERVPLVMDPVTERESQIRRHRDYPHIYVHLDYIITNAPDPTALECKTANAHAFAKEDWGDEYTDQVPAYYNIQCQQQIAVMEYDYVYLAVLGGGNQFKVYRINRNDRLITHMLSAGDRFWNDHVLAGVAPQADGSESSIDALKDMYPGTSEPVAITASEEINELVGQWADLDFTYRDAAARIKKIQASLLEFMGNATELYVEDVLVATYRRSGPSLKFDADAFKTEHPDLFEKYLVEKEGSRRWNAKFRERYVKEEQR